jgi:hypothetical protein
VDAESLGRCEVISMRIVKKPKKSENEPGDEGKRETPSGLPPNNRLKRHADEAYGDTDIPAHKRADSGEIQNQKKVRSERTRNS